jgi:hypothetical protein
LPDHIETHAAIKAEGHPDRPPAAQPTAPTPAQAVVLGTAAGQSIDPATQSPAEAEAAAERAMQNAGERSQLTLAPEVYKDMASEFIQQLEARGAFAAQVTPETQVDHEPGEDVADAVDETPKKKTLAARLLGE